ncbi:MAG: hypothetical protein JWP15_2508 [Alphaproteobacteria bacterium]|nr:hypothetical protein [Alphaproteobacteria bacterium]
MRQPIQGISKRDSAGATRIVGVDRSLNDPALWNTDRQLSALKAQSRPYAEDLIDIRIREHLSAINAPLNGHDARTINRLGHR